MKINERLNLVIPLYDAEDRIYAYVHSVPLSREVFEANFMLLSKTFAAIHGEGLGSVAGPRVAAMVMRDVAAKTNAGASATSLMNEIRRLSNVLIATDNGWDHFLLQDAISRQLIDADDLAEVENALVFFITLSAMHKRQMLLSILSVAASLWGGAISSLDFMAFRASLPTSTAIANSGEIAAATGVVITRTS